MDVIKRCIIPVTSICYVAVSLALGPPQAAAGASGSARAQRGGAASLDQANETRLPADSNQATDEA
jgi:hypothetical protein